MLEQWCVFLLVMIGPLEYHPAVYKKNFSIYVVEEFIARLRVQTHYQQDIPEPLVRIIKNDILASIQHCLDGQVSKALQLLMMLLLIKTSLLRL